MPTCEQCGKFDVRPHGPGKCPPPFQKSPVTLCEGGSFGCGDGTKVGSCRCLPTRDGPKWAMTIVAHQPFDAEGAWRHFPAWGYAMSVAVLAAAAWATGIGWGLDTWLRADSVVEMESGERVRTFLPLVLLWFGGMFGVPRLLYVVSFPRFRKALGENGSAPGTALGALMAALAVAAAGVIVAIAAVVYYAAIVTLVGMGLVFAAIAATAFRR